VRFPAAEDRLVADALRALPAVGAGVAASGERQRAVLARAELHGVAGVLWDAWKAAGVPVDRELALRAEAGAIARELDHEGHIAMLRRIDAHLAVPATALKGPLFARRYYAHPSARGTSDIDLLIDESELERVIASLAPLGYTVFDSHEEVAWSRREHHHLHLTRPRSPDLELHFHAHRGFGVTLRSDTLAERNVAVDGFVNLRVPAAEDELVFLAVHAASHRFGRLSWLYDMRLVVESMSPDQLALAARRARSWGVSRVLALTAELLVDVLGVSRALVRPLGSLSTGLRPFVRAVVAEPRSGVLRSATRFAYTTMLADSMAASVRYAKASSFAHARRVLGRD
jgi:hypothetical protein